MCALSVKTHPIVLEALENAFYQGVVSTPLKNIAGAI
jgi:hypothetical protein